ncbi:tyrosine-type recombinase/integrase, partial [Candidatus Halobonum tyrrellensis]
GLGLRCGLRSAEIVAVTPADVVDGPAGTMLRVREDAAKGDKYRETPVPPNLATTIRTVDDVREEPSDAPLVDASTRTVRRWVKQYAERAAAEYDDDGWLDLSAHDFRRTWATLLAGAAEVDPLLVCEWGGWSDLETFLEHYRGSYSPEVQREARDSVGWL